MRGASMILRRFAGSYSIGNNLIVSSAAAAASYSTLSLAEDGVKPLFASAVSHGVTAAFNPVFMNHSRNFSSPPSSGSSKVVSIETEKQFNDLLHKAEEESQPTLLYFTASWCGPCRLLSPVIDHLSEIYPHVSIYKIDIDQCYLVGVMDNIHSLPTMRFYQNGKKAREVVGADIELLKGAMKELYQ